MKEEITVSWLDKMAFSTVVNGHPLILDANKESGGENRGPRPKHLMLVALAGCTAMDVVSLLEKMRIKLAGLRVTVAGDITDDHPKHFIRMHIIYNFSGKDLAMEKLKKAVDLSQQKYCGVSATYRKAMELTSEINVAESE
jgi:putative redox protein